MSAESIMSAELTMDEFAEFLMDEIVKRPIIEPPQIKLEDPKIIKKNKMMALGHTCIKYIGCIKNIENAIFNWAHSEPAISDKISVKLSGSSIVVTMGEGPNKISVRIIIYLHEPEPDDNHLYYIIYVESNPLRKYFHLYVYKNIASSFSQKIDDIFRTIVDGTYCTIMEDEWLMYG